MTNVGPTANNDQNENPYDINLIGFGTAAVAPSMDALAVELFSAMPAGASKTVITVNPADGLKYLTLMVTKAPEMADQRQVVEVSSNLVDWYSGRNHTTVLRDDSQVLTVRDNTPLSPATKRYIRLRKAGL